MRRRKRRRLAVRQRPTKARVRPTSTTRSNGNSLEHLLAKSPAALEGFGALRGALQSGSLNPRLRAAIALVVSEANGCCYCLTRNVTRARAAGLDDDAIAAARRARSVDEAECAALVFAEGLVYAHGNVSDAEITRLRAAGYGDGDVVEIIATVVLVMGENYFALAERLAPEGPERVGPLYDC